MKNNRFVILISVVIACAFLFSCKGGKAKVSMEPPSYELITTPEDSVLAEKILLSLSEKTYLPTRDLMVEAAKMLLSQPYVAGTLEGGDHESLRVYLTQTDCILFVEAVFNLALTAKQGGKTFHEFADNVRQCRYRDGVVRNYSDRIHYTTEWIRQQEERGLVRDVTLEVGGEIYDHPINFMSTHPSSYKQLKNAATDPVAAHDLEVITEVENTLNEIPLNYIPQGKIASIQDKILSGDIIGYMSNTDGLDIAHVVMAYVQDDPSSKGGHKVGFIHASMGKMEVIVDPLSIDEYISKSRSCNGIKVVRVL